MGQREKRSRLKIGKYSGALNRKHTGASGVLSLSLSLSLSRFLKGFEIEHSVTRLSLIEALARSAESVFKSWPPSYKQIFDAVPQRLKKWSGDVPRTFK
jgi:hypothetical protein